MMPNLMKIGMHSLFGPITPVDFEAFFKKNWTGLIKQVVVRVTLRVCKHFFHILLFLLLSSDDVGIKEMLFGFQGKSARNKIYCDHCTNMNIAYDSNSHE